MKAITELFTLRQVHYAALRWYGSTSLDNCCLAENRLMKGGRPLYWSETFKDST